MDTRKYQSLSRRDFLKFGVAGISATALLFLSGCLGGEEDDDDDDDEGDD